MPLYGLQMPQKFHDCGLCNQQIHGGNNFTPKSRGFEIVVDPKFFSLHKKKLDKKKPKSNNFGITEKHHETYCTGNRKASAADEGSSL